MRTGTPVFCGQTVREEDAARADGCTGVLWANSEGSSGRTWEGMRRACTGKPVHYEQTVRERVARSGRGCGERVRIHRYTGTL